MPTHILTVRHAHHESDGIWLSPGVKVSRSPHHVKSMTQGSRLELRYPDGRVTQSKILSFGIRAERKTSGELIFDGDPNDAEIMLMLPAAQGYDIPFGVEVWLL